MRGGRAKIRRTIGAKTESGASGRLGRMVPWSNRSTKSAAAAKSGWPRQRSRAQRSALGCSL
jgi:hypothetical protein